MSDTDNDKKITEVLYEHNLELAVKNKTLSLLEELYQRSILNLSPEKMSQEIDDTIRKDLNLEFSGILLWDRNSDTLLPLAFSKTDRLLKILKKLGFSLKEIKITNASEREFFKKVVSEHKENISNDIEEVWRELIKSEHLAEIKKESHLKTFLVYPLLTDKSVMGVLLLGLNRDYNALNSFEKESIKSFINVIALSLDKVFLYKNLQDANESLRNLVRQREALTHLITHKIKGSFTRSKYVFAGILDGMFGPINDNMKKYVEQGLESDDNGVKTIDLILNAANLQKGTVKYDMKPVDLKIMVAKKIDEKKDLAEKKGLKLNENMDESEYKINGDAFWLEEVINNFIENAIHYTPNGEVVVGLEKKDKKILFSVKDTGVGITDEDKKNLFTEGGRGKDSVKVNVDSTGYGLYTVKLVVEAHGGRVWAESEGAGKGTTFFAEFDAI